MTKALALALVTACGAADHAAPSLAAPPSGPPAAGEWATWSRDQKRAYMESTVMPAERALFVGFEPARYARFDCRVCHGLHANGGTYKMPDPELPKLVGGADGFGELKQHEPEVLHFMQQVVAPETAELLGLPVFDMEKHVGFSCWNCHLRYDKP